MSERVSRREAFERLAGLAALPAVVGLPSKPEIHHIELAAAPPTELVGRSDLKAQIASLHRNLFENYRETADTLSRIAEPISAKSSE